MVSSNFSRISDKKNTILSQDSTLLLDGLYCPAGLAFRSINPSTFRRQIRAMLHHGIVCPAIPHRDSVAIYPRSWGETPLLQPSVLPQLYSLPLVASRIA